MTTISTFYPSGLALLTDQYQMAMAYGYWKHGLAEREAVFTLAFRKPPFDGGYTIACGLTHAVDFLRPYRFTNDDIAFVRSLEGADGRPLFEPPFLDYLADLQLQVEVDAIPEGSVVFPHEPLLRVRGPLAQCQLLETPLLNIVNFQTLIATKAARICQQAGELPVLEFGLRRAQGFDGGLSASWAAYVGGCAATSNLLAGKLFGIPVKGTHAHSWVMTFDEERESFDRFAEAMPNNCVFLVDTYNTLEGVRRAIATGVEMRKKGHEMLGIRLDSGDLAWLSQQARRMLDDAGFPQVRIVASSDLDEHLINSLRQQDARIDVWGVGTRLVTGWDQPALAGVYKLGALRDPEGNWQYRIKVSEQAVKTNNPGSLQVRRYYTEDGRAMADAIYEEGLGIGDAAKIVDPKDHTRRKRIAAGTPYEDLLIPVLRDGRIMCDMPSVHDIRRRVQEQLGRFDPTTRRLVNPHEYPVGLERRLFELKTRLMLQARGMPEDEQNG
jgi:nicotinate phosphoribosyltransferase